VANFIGEYGCKLDAKGRFLLPSGLKKQLDPSAEEKFVMNRGFEGCLVLYPMNEWENETNRFKELNLFVAKNRRFYRQFHNGATRMQLDSSGRLNVPKALAESAGIEKDVVLFAYANRIEIWDKKKYGDVMGEEMTGFESLAEEVMGELEQKECGSE
jgi:MraZ protein